MPNPNYSEYALDVVYAPEDGVDLVPTKIELCFEHLGDQPQNIFLEGIMDYNAGGMLIPLDHYAEVYAAVICCIGDEPLGYRYTDARTAAVFYGVIRVNQPNETDSVCHLDPTAGLLLACATGEETTRAHVVIYGRRA